MHESHWCMLAVLARLPHKHQACGRLREYFVHQTRKRVHPHIGQGYETWVQSRTWAVTRMCLTVSGLGCGHLLQCSQSLRARSPRT